MDAPACARRRLAAIFVLPMAFACSRGGVGTPDSARSEGGAADSMIAAVPVQMTTVALRDMNVTVNGPGRTDALDVQKIRAPFAGVLSTLRVVVGERVASGQVLGSITSQPSLAAVTGAQAMLASASTTAERADAERALALARQNLVATALRAPRGGTVVSRGASQGDLLSPGDSIVSIASAGSIVFVAQIAQGNLARVFPGQRALITLPGQSAAVEGSVHGLLPADTSGGMVVPVRIDLRGAPVAGGAPIQAGLFGTASIIVGQHTSVPTVPSGSVLRDDISGISRIAMVSADGRAHWITVVTGASQDSLIEIITPRLAAGQRVVVTGQVGLPEGSRVRAAHLTAP